MRCKQHNTIAVNVGGVIIGGGGKVVIQSMTNTATEDIAATVNQVTELVCAGSELVRITINTEKAANAVPEIYNTLKQQGLSVPLIGDFHFNGHYLLAKYPECAKVLAKYRINPGNIGSYEKKDNQFATMIEIACRYNKVVRIGVNWGSLDQQLITKMMDKNTHLNHPKSFKEVIYDTMVKSALQSAKRAKELGLKSNQIILSCKMSGVQDLINVYQQLALKCNYALHLGLTEAGIGLRGIVASTTAIAILQQKGIGDTIRISLTPQLGQSRTFEVAVAKQILQSMELNSFVPQVISCPGCGRTKSTLFQELAQEVEDYLNTKILQWRKRYPGVEKMHIAVMGCVVNGPGESKYANVGISLPGTGESPSAVVFVDGCKFTILKGNKIAKKFKVILNDYVRNHYNH